MDSLRSLSPDELAALATALAVTLFHSIKDSEDVLSLASLLSTVSSLLALMAETPQAPETTPPALLKD